MNPRFFEVLNTQLVAPSIAFLLPLFILLDILALAALIYAIRKGLHFRPDFDLGIKRAKHMLSLRERMVLERWNTVTTHISSNSPEAARTAIIEADNLITEILRELGIPGDDLADQLTNLELEEMRSDEELLTAHRLKRDLTETPGFVVTVEEGRRAIAAYEAFLRELGLLGEPTSQPQFM